MSTSKQFYPGEPPCSFRPLKPCAPAPTEGCGCSICAHYREGKRLFKPRVINARDSEYVGILEPVEW